MGTNSKLGLIETVIKLNFYQASVLLLQFVNLRTFNLRKMQLNMGLSGFACLFVCLSPLLKFIGLVR